MRVCPYQRYAPRKGNPLRAPGLLAVLLLLFTSPLFAIGPAPLVFEVTSTEDSGPGTLRAAVEMANLLCVPFSTTCSIVSAIAECGTGGAPPKITLDSPLPPITAWNLSIGGRTAAACRAVSPWLELDGSRLKQGNGLSIAGDPLTAGGNGIITGLVINGFPDNGIDIYGFHRNMQIAGNFIGTDASGERAIPNQRGIAVGGAQARTTITGNVISGNRRSAIFLWEAGVTDIRGNRIGVSASLQRLPNGASGVFINSQTLHTTVRENTIRHHPHFGIAAARNTKFDQGFNLLFDNTLDVDVGVDGPSPNDADETDGILNAPEIFDAVYDPVRDVTTVHGRLRTIGGRYARNVEIFFYVARRLGGFGYATGAGLIGFHDIGSIPDRAIIEIPFTVEIRPFDAPELFVTAQTVAYNEPLQFLYTSEFSKPVHVNGSRATVKEIGPDVE